MWLRKHGSNLFCDPADLVSCQDPEPAVVEVMHVMRTSSQPDYVNTYLYIYAHICLGRHDGYGMTDMES